MDFKKIAELLETETSTRAEVIELLQGMQTNLNDALRLLGGKGNGARPRANGSGATREVVLQAMQTVRKHEPSLTADELEQKVREHLKANGKTLRGFGNQWKAVQSS